jgi:hypothetical protein
MWSDGWQGDCNTTEYTFDSLGNIIEKVTTGWSDGLSANTSTIVKYIYDENGYIIEENTYEGSDCPGCMPITFNKNYYWSELSNPDIVNIPDTAFLNVLIERGVDTNSDSLISYEEAEAITKLHLAQNLSIGCNVDPFWTGIKDLTGIEAFSNLVHLECSCGDSKDLDLSSNTKLEILECYESPIENLNISNCINLYSLDLLGNNLTHLDISNNTDITGLVIHENPLLEEICVWDSFNPDSISSWMDGCPNAYYTADCVYSNDSIVFIPDTAFLYALIKEGVDTNGDGLISYNEAALVTSITATYKDIQSITGIEAFINLKELVLYYNQIDTLDISNNTGLIELDLNGNKLTHIDVSMCYSLERLFCQNNLLTGLDVSINKELKILECHSNMIETLDLSENRTLKFLWCSDMPSLGQVCVWDSFVPMDECPEQDFYGTDTVCIDSSSSPNVYFSTDCGANIVEIPDSAFLYALIDKGVDANGDSLITRFEAEAITELDISEKGISDLTGIEAFINLDTLRAHYNSFTKIDLSALTKLTDFRCWESNLTELDISNTTELVKLIVPINNLSELDISNNPNLIKLNAHTNNLTNLNTSNNPDLINLWILHNEITQLDLAANEKLQTLWVSDNPLNTLDISNNRALNEIEIENMPSLSEVCVWTTPFPPTGVNVLKAGSPNVYFKDCTLPELHITNDPDSIFQPVQLEAISSEKGTIYLVPAGTQKDCYSIREACTDSVAVEAEIPVTMNLSELQNGDYWLVAADISGNLSEPASFSIYGVEVKEHRSNEFRIHPNPAHTVLTIESGLPGSYQLKLMNINGQCLYNATMEKSIHQMDLTSLQNGIYFISIISPDDVTTRKIIKY